MVFGVQKGGFCIAKVWFLFFEYCVVTIRLECFRNLFAAKWQAVSSCRGPIYRARIYEYTHEMEDSNVRAVMCMHVFDDVKTRN